MRFLPFDFALRNAARRPLRSVFLVLASALVTILWVLTSSFVRSLQDSQLASAPKNTAMLLSASSERDLVRSSMSQSVADLVAAAVPGIVRVGGRAASSPEIHMATKIRTGSEETQRHAFVRGVTPRAFLVHESVTIVRGHEPGPGQVLVGRLAARKCQAPPEHFEVGKTLRIEGGRFEISGEFVAPGSTIESEIWVPLAELQSRSQRDDISAVFARLEDADALGDVELFANRRLDLELIALGAEEYYRELASYFAPILALSYGMAVLIGLAAALGGANLLLSTIQERQRELAVFRAIGFPGRSLLVLVFQEILLLAGAGALLGMLAAQWLLKGAVFGMAMSAFALEVDAISLLVGLFGILGVLTLGAAPALLHVLRRPITEALDSD